MIFTPTPQRSLGWIVWLSDQIKKTHLFHIPSLGCMYILIPVRHMGAFFTRYQGMGLVYVGLIPRWFAR